MERSSFPFLIYPIKLQFRYVFIRFGFGRVRKEIYVVFHVQLDCELEGAEQHEIGIGGIMKENFQTANKFPNPRILIFQKSEQRVEVLWGEYYISTKYFLDRLVLNVI